MTVAILSALLCSVSLLLIIVSMKIYYTAETLERQAKLNSSLLNILDIERKNGRIQREHLERIAKLGNCYDR